MSAPPPTISTEAVRAIVPNTTPGPWTTEPGLFWVCTIGNNPADPGVWSRAIPISDGVPFPFGDKDADAALIAAAPELYDALETALQTLQTEGVCGAECLSCKEARAILAKARGEAA